MTPIITDSRGWALFDLAVNLKLDYSLARHNAEQGVLEFGRLAARQPLIWPQRQGRNHILAAYIHSRGGADRHRLRTDDKTQTGMAASTSP